MKTIRRIEQGQIQTSVFVIIALALLVLVFGVFSVWSYTHYLSEKTNVDGKIKEATAQAILDTSKKDEAKFEEINNQTLRQFTGPDDYGRLTFDYPKAWSAYQATDVSKGGGATYDAYLNPTIVPPISDKQKFALRVEIKQKTYADSVSSYSDAISDGDLKSSVFTNGTVTGTKLVGKINDDIYGTIVLIKMRDWTVTLRTDGDVFQKQFDALLKTVKFNQ